VGAGADSGLGDHPALATHVAQGSIPPRLLESDSAIGAAVHGRVDLPCAGAARLRTAAWTRARRSRSRNTLNAGLTANLPWHAFGSTNVYYGSGFTNGLPDAQYPGDYLPQHTTVDIALGKSFGEADKYRLSINALNVANRRVLLDNSLTFGGFHYNDPRQIYAEFRWRFHY